MIKNIIFTLILGLIALAMQTMLLPEIIGENYTPNLVTVLIVFLAMHHVNHFGLLAIFMLGLLVDLSYAEVLGLWTSAYLLIFMAILLLARQLFVESRTVIFFAVFICAWCAEIIYLFGIGKIYKMDLLFFWQFSVGCLVAAIFGSVIFSMLKKILPNHEARKRF